MIPGLPIPSGGEIKMAVGIALALALIAIGAGGAWEIQANRYETRIARVEKTHAETMKAISDKAAAAEAENLAKLNLQQAAIAALDERHTKEIADAKIENDRLRAAVDAGSVQLRIRAACPAGGGAVPGSSGTARVDDGTAVELAPSARSAYFQVRDGITSDQAKLRALQDYVRAILAKPNPATLPVPQAQE